MAANKKRIDWYPATLARQREMYAAILANIEEVNNTLGANADRIKRLKDLCTAWLEFYDKLQLNRATIKALNTAFGTVTNGKPGVEPMPVAPVFHQLTLPAGEYVGLEAKLRDFRDYLTGLFEWSDDMGDVLKLNGEETLKTALEDSAPVLEIGKIQTNSVEVKIFKGEADEVEFQYRRAGTELWQPLVSSGAAETVLKSRRPRREWLKNSNFAPSVSKISNASAIGRRLTTSRLVNSFREQI